MQVKMEISHPKIKHGSVWFLTFLCFMSHFPLTFINEISFHCLCFCHYYNSSLCELFIDIKCRRAFFSRCFKHFLSLIIVTLITSFVSFSHFVDRIYVDLRNQASIYIFRDFFLLFKWANLIEKCSFDCM